MSLACPLLDLMQLVQMCLLLSEFPLLDDKEQTLYSLFKAPIIL